MLVDVFFFIYDVRLLSDHFYFLYPRMQRCVCVYVCVCVCVYVKGLAYAEKNSTRQQIPFPVILN